MTESIGCSPAFRQLIKLAAIGSTGRQADIKLIDWQEVLLYAREQSVLPLVACALLVQSDIECLDSLREQLLEMMRGQSGANFVRKIRVFHLINEMEAAGIDVKLIKGYAVGSCYAYPDSRGSTDTDLLIMESQEPQVYDFLRRKGFRVGSRGETEHHAICQHPKYGMVEVHVQLYVEIIQSVWFKDAKFDRLIREESIRVHNGNDSYSTLCYTDHLIFLTLHMIKHFIYDGLGLRMMLDIALFFKNHQAEINIQRYWAILEELRYSKVVRAVMWALIDTGCFAVEDFPGLQPVEADAVELLLHDLEIGGHMGVKQGKENRLDGYYEYSRQVILREKSPMQYCLYMFRYKIRSSKKQMFPAREQLIKLYPMLAKKNWLTPFARIHRMFTYPIQKIRAGVLKEQIRSNSTEMPEEAKRRVEMFKALGMI